jgi:DNA-binding transcriptional LysR family regulator
MAVAEHLNFSKAAKQLNLSQPPLTRHVQSLEEKLGSKLFVRNTHAVSLTNAGKLFLEDARAILRHLDRAAETIRRSREGETTRLRLAFVGALLDEKLVRLMQRFREVQPACQLEVNDLPPADQLAAIEAGEIDGGFIGATPARKTKGLAFVIWRREPLVLVLPEAHPLTKVGDLRWRQLKELTWVMVSRRAAPAFRQQFSDLAVKHALAPQIVQESERVPAVLTMVAAGLGVTILPETAGSLVAKGLARRKLPSPPPILCHTFAHRPSSGSPALKAFLALLR